MNLIFSLFIGRKSTSSTSGLDEEFVVSAFAVTADAMNAQAVQERSLNLKKVLIDDSKIARLVLRKHGAEKYGKLWLEKTRNRIEESSEDSEESDTDTEGKYRVVK